MSTAARAQRSLHVVPGYRQVSVICCGVRVAAAREDDPPFSVDAEVLEEDTWLALSAPADIISDPGPPVRVMTRVWEARPELPGTVIVRRGTPMKLLAVVHDLNAEPSWTEERVEQVLSTLFEIVDGEGVRALQLPMLATRHGRLQPERFMRLLRAALERRTGSGSALRAVWLVRENQCGAQLLRLLTDQ
ncbi:MAG: hypothetical protein PVJ49_14300 [Acidobacteriota bacterium]|jgi:hypothetical protein